VRINFEGQKIVNLYRYLKSIRIDARYHVRIEQDGVFVIHFKGQRFRNSPRFKGFMGSAIGSTRRYRHTLKIDDYEIPCRRGQLPEKDDKRPVSVLEATSSK